MSTDTVASSTPVPPAPTRDPGKARAADASSQVAGMLNSLARLADLQVAIWLSSVRRLVVQLVMVSVLGVLALLAVIVAILFLYAGVFHVLTDFLGVPTAWALLIFAGAHLALAGTFAMAAVVILNRRQAQAKKPGDAT